jgi:hypothetical protein
MKVDVPKPEMTDYGRAQITIEVAFGALLKQAKESGLKITPVMGLEYLPEQDLAEPFKRACRAILLACTPTDSHVRGSDGNQYWVGDGNIPG